MNYLLLAVGVLLVVFASLDAIWSTLWVEGHAGPIARRLGLVMSRLYGAVVTSRHPRLLSARAPIVLLSSIGTWAFLLWLGWTLVFASSRGALVLADGGAPADFWDRAYFVGYTISTMGNGDIVPTEPVWQVMTGVCGLSGLVLLTLVVTYLMQVVQAVVVARSFASMVRGLGATAEEFVGSWWDGQSFRMIEPSLHSLIEQLNLSTEQHQAYPMLHYHRAQSERKAIDTAICVLDESITLLSFGVAPDVRPAPGVLRLGRAAVDDFLRTVEGTYIHPAERTPPGPALSLLQSRGIPTVGDTEFAAALANMADRRRLLLALVEQEGREWPESRITG